LKINAEPLQKIRHLRYAQFALCCGCVITSVVHSFMIIQWLVVNYSLLNHGVKRLCCIFCR